MHNNYLTLPVVFTMLAGHFPLAFGHDHAWLVLLAIFALVVAIRHFFNLWHVGTRPWWILGGGSGRRGRARVRARAGRRRDGGPASDGEAAAIVAERCAVCHSGVSAPLGVELDTIEAQIKRYAGAIERR